MPERLRFGIGLPNEIHLERRAKAIEELGCFDYLLCGEHVFFSGITTNAFVMLAAAAQVTTTMKLVSFTLLPVYPAALAAKMSATLDVVSDGRFIMGVAVGGEYEEEFSACGVPVKERGARANEALQIIRKLMTGQEVSFTGKFARLEGVRLQPSPVQASGPPIWIGGRSEAAMRRTARYGDGWLPYMYSPSMLKESIEKIDVYAKEEGDGQWEGTATVLSYMCVDQDSRRAKRVAGEVVGELYKLDGSRLVDKYMVAGNPAECRQRIAEYRDAGAEVVHFNLAALPDEEEAMLRLLKEEVLNDWETSVG